MLGLFYFSLFWAVIWGQETINNGDLSCQCTCSPVGNSNTLLYTHGTAMIDKMETVNSSASKGTGKLNMGTKNANSQNTQINMARIAQPAERNINQGIIRPSGQMSQQKALNSNQKRNMVNEPNVRPYNEPVTTESYYNNNQPAKANEWGSPSQRRSQNPSPQENNKASRGQKNNNQARNNIETTTSPVTRTASMFGDINPLFFMMDPQMKKLLF